MVRNNAEDRFDHLHDSPVLSSVAISPDDGQVVDRPPGKVQIGDLYRTKGARKGYWLIVAIRDEGPISGPVCVCLGLSLEGEIVSACTYGYHYFERKTPDGWINLTK